ncbi:MAG: class I SAM-dependent methyltransferase [bacterium]
MDCPCGYGRHSIQLAKNNLLVTGSDINETHLSRAKANALQENTDIVWEKESMIDIRYDNEFDVVINMFYSFGFFETDEENEKVLKNFYDALKKNGRFLMHTDVNIPRIISGKYKKDEIRNLQNGNTLRIIDDYNPATKRIE